jgi:hypothetical protein
LKYHHIGIPTKNIQDKETYLEQYKLFWTNHNSNPYGIRWMRYEPDCQLPEIVKTVPHVAFEVEDHEKALKNRKVIIKPNSPLKE